MSPEELIILALSLLAVGLISSRNKVKLVIPRRALHPPDDLLTVFLRGKGNVRLELEGGYRRFQVRRILYQGDVEGELEVQVRLTELPAGIYNIVLYEPDGTKCVVENVITVIREPPLKPIHPIIFGVCEHYTSDLSEEFLEKEFNDMKKALVGWVRTDFHWEEIEPKKGEYNFSFRDRLIELAEKRGIKILPILGYCTKWAGPKVCAPPRDLSDYARYVAVLVSRYKDRINLWEVWNEPNIRKFWDASIEEYVQLLKAACKAIRQASPHAKILLGGLAGADTEWFKQFIELGGGDYCDVIAFHPYSKSSEETVRRILEMSKVAGDKWSLAITEIGFPTHKGGFNELEQAISLVKVLAAARCVERMMLTLVYEWRDGGLDPNDPEHNFGIVHTLDEKSKPPYPMNYPKHAYFAYRTMASLIGGKDVKCEYREIGDRFIFLFSRPDGYWVIVAWSLRKERIRIELNQPPTEIKEVDIYGNIHEPPGVDVKDRLVELDLDEIPRILVLRISS